MSIEELADTYARERADALCDVYTDVSPKEWKFEYDLAYKEYINDKCKEHK